MANYREDIVNIELTGGSIHRSFAQHAIGGGDEAANRFGIRTFRNGEPENINGSVFGLFIRADGGTVAIESGTVSENVAYVTLPSACYAVEGCFTLAIKVTGTNMTGTMRIVDGMVSRTSTDTPIDPGTILPTIDDLIESINEAVASIPADYSELSDTVDDLVADSIEQFGKRIAGQVTDLTDFNDALPNRIYTITKNIDNAPPEPWGTLISVNGDTNYTSGKIHLFVAQSGNLYFRMLWGAGSGTWTAWKKAKPDDNEIVTGYGKRIEGSVTDLTDFNNALPNRVYTITKNIDNAPPEPWGTLISVNGDTNYTSGKMHLFVAQSGNLYFRMLWGAGSGTWTAWKKASVNSQSNEDYYSGIEMFEHFGVIGDSFASGVIYIPGETQDREHYSLSWGQILARMTGNDCENYSKGGYNTYAFVNSSDSAYNTYGLGKVLADIQGGDAKGLYLLCLGINDSNNTRTYGDKTGGLNYLGSSSDINSSDPSQNANSFWGNYGRIISTIKTASPDSRIVLCTFARIPTTATAEAYDEYIEAIQEIAEYFSLPCITLTDDEFFTSSYYLNSMVGSHPTAPQYVGYAKAINRLLSQAIVNNYNYFKEYIGIS